jgi:uncharacterized Zn finger protein (UPF0148 family)
MAEEIVPGIEVVDIRCPKCKGPAFKKPCPCPFKRKGWAICGRCFNPACATIFGITKRKRGPRIRGGPFGNL